MRSCEGEIHTQCIVLGKFEGSTIRALVADLSVATIVADIPH